MMTLVENKITNRCVKSVYHSGEHVVTYTKTLCLFSLHQEHLSHWGPKPYAKTLSFSLHQEHLSQWGPKPYTRTLCLFHCTKSIDFITMGTKTLQLMSFLLHQEYVSQWGPKPYTKTLCLFEANELVRS